MAMRTPVALPLEGYKQGPRGRHESSDGRRILDWYPLMQSVRDFEGAGMRAAKALTENPKLAEACVAVSLRRFSRERARKEWSALKAMLRPTIADRLALVALDETGTTWVDPDEPRLRKLAQKLTPRGTTESTPTHRAVSRKFFEVLKVLVDHWLLGHGPIAIVQLVRESGSSYPTVAEAVDRLVSSRELVRRSPRAVELADFPMAAWNEMLALGDAVRLTQSWIDVSGHQPDPQALLARVAKLRPDGVAVGGVVAARHYDPQFDLHGTPRLDLCIRGHGAHPLDLAGDLDPVLQLTQDRQAPAVLVLHLVTRPFNAFEESSKGLPWASPVETLLDLHELRLVEQAEQLVARLTKGRRR